MRNEYPRPQLVRDDWQCLNGAWEFEMDSGNSGLERGLFEQESLSGRIQVPFCPESALSGIHETDFMICVWYAKNFPLPPVMRGKRVLLHFEAADFETQVWCNGTYVGGHRGGYTPFSFDITEHVNNDPESENRLVVRCYDNTRSDKQATGKQCGRYFSESCFYTRTTGLWQTVWLEAVPERYITQLRYQTDIVQPTVTVTVFLSGHADGDPLHIKTFFEGRDTGQASLSVMGCQCTVTIPLTEKQLWECGQGRLYTIQVQAGEDMVESYFGLRDVSIKGRQVLINGKPIFQRLVLDQGFYPDGIYTAPSDEALVKDIELSLEAGFNGARLHQKVFEQRFLYHADRLGYLIWDEYPSWGLNLHTPGLGLSVMLPEWLEVVNRDINHPSVVGWCPLNETFDGQDNALLYSLYQMTKALDPTRPIIDTSGFVHVVTDIHDVHDYEQDPQVFGEHYTTEALRQPQPDAQPNGYRYDAKIPFFVSEYGGIWWNAEDTDGWGYGERVKDEEEFYTRLEGLTDILMKNPEITAFCYTQLTDVEQEQNGIYHYDRSRKFNMERIKGIFSKEAAIERA